MSAHGRSRYVHKEDVCHLNWRRRLRSRSLAICCAIIVAVLSSLHLMIDIRQQFVFHTKGPLLTNYLLTQRFIVVSGLKLDFFRKQIFFFNFMVRLITAVFYDHGCVTLVTISFIAVEKVVRKQMCAWMLPEITTPPDVGTYTHTHNAILHSESSSYVKRPVFRQQPNKKHLAAARFQFRKRRIILDVKCSCSAL